MSVDTLSTALLWAIAGVVVLAAVGMVVARRLAARVLIGAVAVLLAIVAFAARAQVSAIPRDSPSELCHHGVRWFGIDLTASDAFCVDWR